GLGKAAFWNEPPVNFTSDWLVGSPWATTLNPLVPGGRSNCTFSPTAWLPSEITFPVYVLATTGVAQLVPGSGSVSAPPDLASGSTEQLFGAAGAEAGVRQTFPAPPVVAQIRPVGHPSPEEHPGAQ